MRYPMSKNTEQPLFNYIVQDNNKYDYYLFEKFDEALKKAIEISNVNRIGLVFEIHFNATTREYKGHNTFAVYSGEVHYDKHAELGLHIEFYINSGEWLNPNEEWLSILKNK